MARMLRFAEIYGCRTLAMSLRRGDFNKPFIIEDEPFIAVPLVLALLA